jgi:GT2 family glycosyltransferase
LERVFDTQYANFDLIVADNASTDSSLQYLVNKGFTNLDKTNPRNPRTIIPLSKNWGFADGYNYALKEIEGIYDYYVLLNSDVEISSGWLSPMIETMENDSTIAAAQPKIRDYHNKESFEYAGASGGWIDMLGYPFCRGRIFETLELDKGQYDNIQEVFWATGAAMVVRSAQYHAIGGLDGNYFAHMEEIDLCWRLKRAGYKIVVCPQSVVFHVGGGTLPKVNSQKTFLNFRNSLLTVLKNAPPVIVFAMVLARLVLDSVAAARFLFKGEHSNIWAITRAHFSFYYYLPRYVVLRFKFRAKLKSLRIGKANLTGLYYGSIVWDYFIKGVKTFSLLPLGMR